MYVCTLFLCVPQVGILLVFGLERSRVWSSSVNHAGIKKVPFLCVSLWPEWRGIRGGITPTGWVGKARLAGGNGRATFFFSCLDTRKTSNGIQELADNRKKKKKHKKVTRQKEDGDFRVVALQVGGIFGFIVMPPAEPQIRDGLHSWGGGKAQKW